MNYKSALHSCRIERIRYEVAKSNVEAMRLTHNGTNYGYEYTRNAYISASTKFENCMLKAMNAEDYDKQNK